MLGRLYAPGDTNVDGQIDILDAANFISGGLFDNWQPAVWSQGDFNYDGVVDILDAADLLGTSLFDQGPFVPALAASDPGAITAVPEPACLPWPRWCRSWGSRCGGDFYGWWESVRLA